MAAKSGLAGCGLSSCFGGPCSPADSDVPEDALAGEGRSSAPVGRPHAAQLLSPPPPPGNPPMLGSLGDFRALSGHTLAPMLPHVVQPSLCLYATTQPLPRDTAEEAPVCRICWEGGGRLVSPCLCAGSMGHVHKACLKKWLTKRRASGIRHSLRCEVCHGQLHNLPPGLMLRSGATAAARVTARAAAATVIIGVGLPVLAVAICAGVAATVAHDTTVYALDAANPGWWQRRTQRRRLQQERALAAFLAYHQARQQQQIERVQQWRLRLAQQQQQQQLEVQ